MFCPLATNRAQKPLLVGRQAWYNIGSGDDFTADSVSCSLDAMATPQMTRIYVTHCSHKKEERYKGTGEVISPDLLYTAKPVQRFMAKCNQRAVRWAIFSDLYGVWFPEVRHAWYEKDPDTVSGIEFWALLRDFDEKLTSYSEIYFYYNPGRFHPLYGCLLNRSALGDRIRRITHLSEII